MFATILSSLSSRTVLSALATALVTYWNPIVTALGYPNLAGLDGPIQEILQGIGLSGVIGFRVVAKKNILG